MLKKLKGTLSKFFFPAPGSSTWLMILPYIAMGVLSFLVLIGGIYGWDYSNSPGFCGTSCHTMPPQGVTYLKSPHANVSCEECHIGRAFVGDLLVHKSEGLRELFDYTFGTYEYPIIASRLRPARYTCETCHLPEVFKDDKLKMISHFKDDKTNTPENTYLILKTGGGAKRDGLGKGIHWHIINKVEYFETDQLGQTIPYIRVQNADGTQNEYVDVESGFDPKTIDQSKLRVMDCTSCHNRVSHNFKFPSTSMDEYMTKNLIDPSIPEIHSEGVKVLSGSYKTQAEGLAAIAALEDFYKSNYSDFYASKPNLIKTAITMIQTIYTDTVFLDQKVNWETHPNNIGHVLTAGCFRCHDGKHLDANNQAIRMECNLCHSIPIVASQQDFVTKIEISRGPEPSSHRSPNWIAMHNKVFDQSCSTCHDTKDAGSTTNTSFCSNSACHGQTYQFAGFNAPKLREVIQAQLPTPMPTATPAPTPVIGAPVDFSKNILPMFGKCAVCHNTTALTAGLDLSSYEGLLKGGKDGAAITPNNSATSLIIIKQASQHFANLSPDEMTMLKQWIDAGAAAPLAAASPAASPTPAPAASGGSATFDANIAAILNTKCTMCHTGAAAPKGLDLSSFASLMKGGTDGPVITAGDSAGSTLIVVQTKPHPANLSADELTLFKQWIDAGAPQK